MAGDLNFSIRLSADGSAFVNGVRVAREELDKLQSSAGNAGGGQDKLTTAMTQGVAQGSLLTDVVKQIATKLVDFTVQAIAAGDRLNDLAIGTGREASELQALDVIARKNGGTLDGMLGILDRMARSMDKGGDDTGKFKTALDFFGVSLTDSSGKAKSAEQTAIDLAVAYRDSAKTADVSAAMQVLLGSKYRDLIPQMLGLVDKETELASLRKYGAEMTDDLKNASARLSDTQVDVQSVMTAMGNALATSVIPTLQAMADWFINSATNGGILEGAAKALGVAFEFGMAVIKSAVTVFILLDEQVQKAGRAVGALAAVIANPGSIGTIWADLKREVGEINDKANTTLKDMWNGIDKVDASAKPIRDRGLFDKGMKAGKKEVEDFSGEIKNLANRLDGITNKETKNYQRALREVEQALLDGKIVTNDQINAYLDLAKKTDAAEVSQRAQSKATRDAKRDTVDLTGEIAKLDAELQRTEDAMFGVETNTKHFDAAYNKLLGLLLDGKVISNDTINLYLNKARALDDAKKKTDDYNDTLKDLVEYGKAEEKAINDAKDAGWRLKQATATQRRKDHHEDQTRNPRSRNAREHQPRIAPRRRVRREERPDPLVASALLRATAVGGRRRGRDQEGSRLRRPRGPVGQVQHGNRAGRRALHARCAAHVPRTARQRSRPREPRGRAVRDPRQQGRAVRALARGRRGQARTRRRQRQGRSGRAQVGARGCCRREGGLIPCSQPMPKPRARRRSAAKKRATSKPASASRSSANARSSGDRTHADTTLPHTRLPSPSAKQPASSAPGAFCSCCARRSTPGACARPTTCARCSTARSACRAAIGQACRSTVTTSALGCSSSGRPRCTCLSLPSGADCARSPKPRGTHSACRWRPPDSTRKET